MSLPTPGFGRRLTCLLYESLVVFSILLIGFLIPQAVLLGNGINVSPRGLMLHIFLLLMVYFVYNWRKSGQTLPMKTWKLRVVDANCAPLRPLQAILRYCAARPSVLLLGAGLLWALFDKDKQFLHDRIAGTQIIAKS